MQGGRGGAATCCLVRQKKEKREKQPPNLLDWSGCKKLIDTEAETPTLCHKGSEGVSAWF